MSVLGVDPVNRAPEHGHGFEEVIGEFGVEFEESAFEVFEDVFEAVRVLLDEVKTHHPGVAL